MTRRMQSTSDGPRNDDLASGSSEGCKTFVVEGPSLHFLRLSHIRITPREGGAKPRQATVIAPFKLVKPQQGLSTRPFGGFLMTRLVSLVDKPVKKINKEGNQEGA